MEDTGFPGLVDEITWDLPSETSTIKHFDVSTNDTESGRNPQPVSTMFHDST